MRHNIEIEKRGHVERACRPSLKAVDKQTEREGWPKEKGPIGLSPLYLSECMLEN